MVSGAAKEVTAGIHLGLGLRFGGSRFLQRKFSQHGNILCRHQKRHFTGLAVGGKGDQLIAILGFYRQDDLLALFCLHGFSRNRAVCAW